MGAPKLTKKQTRRLLLRMREARTIPAVTPYDFGWNAALWSVSQEVKRMVRDGR